MDSTVLDARNSTILDVDYRKLVSRADLTYDKPVSHSESGLPVGNGRMGSLVWTSPTTLRFQINRVDVYANNSATNSFNRRNIGLDVSDYCSGCGFVDVDFVDFGADVFPAGKTRQHLSVYDAQATIEGKGIKARILAWHEHDVMAIEIDDQREEPSTINTNLRMLRPAVVVTKNHTATSKLEIHDGKIILTQEFTEGNYFCSSAVAIGIVGRKTKARLANETEVRLAAEPGQGKFTILIASAASFDSDEDVVGSALEQLKMAADREYEELFDSNKRWWHDFWRESFVHLHSADGVADYVEENYTYYLYVMASSSRGKLPPKFNGMLWTTKGDLRGWGNQHWYHNVSCLYNGLFAANHLELLEPMFEMYTGMYDSCALAASQQWGSKGIHIPETVWFDGLAALPEDIAAEMKELYLLEKPWELRSLKFREYADKKHPRSSRWNWKAAGEWIEGRFTYTDKGYPPFGEVLHIFSSTDKIAFQYWLRYEYTLDREWLRDYAYPIIKGAAEFHRNYPNVKKGQDGKYHIHNVNNHEPLKGGQDAIEEISGMKGILPVAIRASEILNVDAESRSLWREFWENLAPYPTNDHPNSPEPREINTPRLWCNALKPILDGMGGCSYHTIVPCIYYDLCTLETDDPEIVAIANATFDKIYPHNVEINHVNLLDNTPVAAAILGRSDDIKTLVPAQLRKESFHENRLSPEEAGGVTPGTTIEAQGRAGEALQRALCQSVPAGPGEEPVIRVFPAWPKEWDAEYTLLCRGGFLVTSSMQNGQIEFVEVKSQLGGECRLRNPWGEDEVTLYRNDEEWTNMAGSLLKFNTCKGENIVVVKKGFSPEQFKRVISV